MRGKSGGHRIIHYLQTTTDVLLVAIYSKSDQSDIHTVELLRIIRDEDCLGIQAGAIYLDGLIEALHPWSLDPGTPCRDDAQERINLVVPAEAAPDLIRANAGNQVPRTARTPWQSRRFAIAAE